MKGEELKKLRKAMLLEKIPIVQIVKFTGLTLEQIQALEKEIIILILETHFNQKPLKYYQNDIV